MTTRVCARCGRSRPRDGMVFSAASRKYYCGPSDWVRCERVAAKARKAVTA